MNMLRRHRRSHPPTVEFCDSCATISTGASRASALREQSLQTALRLSPRM
jgi:hypothetical protein